MAQTQQSSVVLEACNQNKAFENLQYCNDTIEKVVKSINAYLHEKQLQFPRFFFLSNEDLLHILSQTKERAAQMCVMCNPLVDLSLIGH